MHEVQGEALTAAQQTIQNLAPHVERYQKMEALMTNPDSLAQYTVDFFTHVHPVQSVREQQAVQQQMQRPSFPDMPAANAQGSGQVVLGQVAPWERYKVADAMEQQGFFRTKVLVQ